MCGKGTKVRLQFSGSLEDIRLFKAKTHCTVGLLTNVEGKWVAVVTQNGKGIEEFCSYISCEVK